MLLTQFWDYDPATGPNDTFTIHGLWSDKCSGGYDQFCNPSWEITDPRGILEDLGKNDLLSVMDTNWKNYDGNDEELWEHEFDKHGTCMATLNPDCYTDDVSNYTYVGDFYQTVVDLWQTLPTYRFLTDAGITPSADKTWTLSEWESAIGDNFDGKTVYLGCDKNNAVTEIWYFYSLTGSVANGVFQPADSISSSTCKDGFKWIPKSQSGSDSGSGGDSGSGSSSYQATLSLETQDGCLISDGTWYATGTCATYTIKSTIGGVSLTSSKGPCNIIDNKLVCSASTSAGDFTISDGYLEYGGDSEWSASTAAQGQTRQSISPGSGSITFKVKVNSKGSAASSAASSTPSTASSSTSAAASSGSSVAVSSAVSTSGAPSSAAASGIYTSSMGGRCKVRA